MAQRIPAIGEDVTALMHGGGAQDVPPIGADVSHLMGESVPQEMGWAIVNGQRVPVDTVDEPGMPAPMAPVPSHEVPGAKTARGMGAEQLLGGVRAGAASTIFHGGDLIRRVLGMERVIDQPDVQAAMTRPPGVLGGVGFAGEQLAEFAVPAARVARAMKAARFLPRVAAEAATGAGVAGVQSGGDTGEMATTAAIGAAIPFAGAAARTARRAAAGAQEGGLGGAVASLVRTTAPIDPKAMMVQALKPSARNPKFGQALDRAMDELKATEAELGKPIANLDDLLTATAAAKKRIRAQYDQMAGPQRDAGFTVDLTPVAKAMERSVPQKVRLEDPGKAAAILGKADVYRTRFSLEDAEQLLKETNAELESFYNKYPLSQRRALTSDPEAAHVVAQADALRTAIYSRLDEAGHGRAARELMRRYGSLLEVEEEATRRYNVARRQQPESLSEQITKARAAGQIARGVYKGFRGRPIEGMADIVGARMSRDTATFLKEQQTTDALIRRAMAAYRGQPTPILMPAHRPVAGLLGRGPIVTPPAADPSFARGVRAQSVFSGRPRQLPEGRNVIPLPGEVAPPVPDPSFVRGVPGEYGAKWVPPAPEPPPAPSPAATTAPAKARITRTPKAKAQAPATAASEVLAEVERVIDVKGVKSAAEVQRRVVAALEGEMEGAKQAMKFGEVEIRPRKAYGGREFDVLVGGNPVAHADRHGNIEAFYGVEDDVLDALGATRPATSKYGGTAKLGRIDNASGMSPSQLYATVRGDFSKRLSRASGTGTIRIHIPGDGTFTIERNPEAIQAVLQRIKSGGTAPWQGLGAQKPSPPNVHKPYWKTNW